MFKSIKSLLFTDTSRDTSIVFTGTLVNALIGGIFFIIAPRILGPSDYGLFAVVTATAMMIANFANFGIDTGILRFINENNQNQAGRILRLAIQSYVVIGIVVFILGLFVSKPLAFILGYPDLTNLLRIAFSATIFILLTDFFVATLQSRKLFFKASLVNISSNASRLLILLMATYFFTIDLYFMTILFFFITLISVAVGKFFVPLDFLSAKDHQKEFKKFFSFNFWIAGSLAISSIPFDNYLLIKLAGPVATGVFAAPYKILSVIDQLGGNFSRVLAPRFTSFENDQKAKNFALRSLPIVLIVCLGIIISIVTAKPLVTLLFGKEYYDSVLIYKIIGASYLFYFANSIPVSLIIYYFGKPKIAFFITSAVVIVNTFGNILLIPKYQALGAAIAEFVTAIISFTLFSAYVLWKFTSRNPNGQN